ncbi:MAG: cytidylate kinase family protein [Clostridia bacterium]|nr:cytidylate kinase family protein [Clostridia bacterium]
MQDKISLAGDLGSGKSTVSKILIDALGAEYYHTGGIVRDVAKKHGMTVGELNVYMETHPEIDSEIDDGLRALSELDKLLIIDSRLAWHFTKGTFKIYLSTDIETSALRIMTANRDGEHAATLEETVAQTRARRASEKKRYMELYGVDIKDLSNYDLVVDTTGATPEEVAAIITSAFYSWQADKSFKAVYICPERLNLHDDAPDHEKIAVLSAALERCEPIPEVTVSESEGEFYIRSGEESALAYTFNMNTFIPARLVAYTEKEKQEKFVKIKNSL